MRILKLIERSTVINYIKNNTKYVNDNTHVALISIGYHLLNKDNFIEIFSEECILSLIGKGRLSEHGQLFMLLVNSLDKEQDRTLVQQKIIPYVKTSIICNIDSNKYDWLTYLNIISIYTICNQSSNIDEKIRRGHHATLSSLSNLLPFMDANSFDYNLIVLKIIHYSFQLISNIATNYRSSYTHLDQIGWDACLSELGLTLQIILEYKSKKQILEELKSILLMVRNIMNKYLRCMRSYSNFTIFHIHVQCLLE